MDKLKLCVDCVHYVPKYLNFFHCCARRTNIITGEPDYRRCEWERNEEGLDERGEWKCGYNGRHFTCKVG